MKVIVSGSRNWNRRDVVWARLDTAANHVHRTGATQLVIVHGAAYPRERHGVRPDESADWLAHLWCGRAGHVLPVVEATFPADWLPCAPDCNPGHRKRNRNGTWYCPTAGRRRNQAMADAGADWLIAFWRDRSGGTGHMIRAAGAAGIPVHIVDYADVQPLNTEKANA